MPSHVGASRIDKAYVGEQVVTAMYLGTEKVFPNTTRWERYTLVWDFSGETFGTGQSSTSNVIDIGTLEIVSSTPAVGDVTTNHVANYNAGAEVSIRQLQSLVSGSIWRYNEYAGKNKAWLATKRAKGTLIDTIEHINENAYPADGIAGYYWYVRK